MILRRLKNRAAYRRAEADFKLLRAFRPGEKHYGYDLSRAIGMRSGRVYPSLARLERRGSITSGWDDGPEPRRRHYVLTAQGVDENTMKVIP